MIREKTDSIEDKVLRDRLDNLLSGNNESRIYFQKGSIDNIVKTLGLKIKSLCM